MDKPNDDGRQHHAAAGYGLTQTLAEEASRSPHDESRGRSRVRPRRGPIERPEDIETELKRLEPLGLEALRKTWLQRFKHEAPSVRSRDVLLRMLAWEIQAAAYGGMEGRAIRKLRSIAEALERDGTYEPKVRHDLTPGVELSREWKGILHKVIVTTDGFQHLGRRYGSLSDIARMITGTRWSGPRFFGLEQRPGHARGKAAAP